MAQIPLLPAVTLSPWHPWSLGATKLGIPASAAWGTANRAIYIPFRLPEPATVVQLFTYNGATAGNNVDVGIYDSAGNRLTSSGSTAQAGTNTIQTYDVTDIPLGVGQFFIALAFNGTTGTIFRDIPGLQFLKAFGCAIQDTAFPLPATATLATIATGFVPCFGWSTRSVV